MPATLNPPAAPSAPAKPASPTPAAPPPKHEPVQPPPEKDQSSWMQSEADELDSLDDDTPKKPQKAKPEEKPKTPPEKPEETDEDIKPPEKPAEKPAEPEKPVKAADLRRAYEESQRKIREELSPKVQKLEAKIRELEASKPTELEPLQQKLTQTERRNAELEQQLEFLDFQRSPKFQKEFWDPYVSKYNEALNELRQVEVEEADGKVRRGTEDDLLELWSLESGALRKRANEKFGDSADDIVPIIKEVQRLGRAQAQALKEAQQNSETRIAERKAQSVTETAERKRKFTEFNEQLAEKFPKFFKPIDGDVEGNKRWNQGLALTELLFPTHELTEEERSMLPDSFRVDLEAHGRLSRDNVIRMHALVRNKAANHDRIAYALKTARAELKEARKTIEQYEQSEPPGGGGAPSSGATGGGKWDDDVNAELDRLDKAGR